MRISCCGKGTRVATAREVSDLVFYILLSEFGCTVAEEQLSNRG